MALDVFGRVNLNAFVVDESDEESDEEDESELTANMHEDTSFPDYHPSDDPELELGEQYAENSDDGVDITDVPVFRFGQHAGVDFRTIAHEQTS